MDILDPHHFMTGDLLYNDVKAYSALGEHRTASEVDRATSHWLARQVEGYGLTAKLAPFRVRQFQLASARLTADGLSIPCFPLWPPRATGAEPVRAAVSHGALKGCVALVRLPKGYAVTTAHLTAIQSAIDQGAAAVIGVTPSESGELMALNVDADAPPWPVPVVLVGLPEEINLRGAAGAAVSIEGREEDRAEAFNTIAETGAGKKRIVVSTPSSGWFHCAGERGPGIAIWLALARWASHRKSNARYTFVASSGHEIGEQGMRQYLSAGAPKPDQVAAWLHLGASIAAKGSTRRLMTNRREFLPALRAQFSADPQPELTQAPLGELGQLAALKYPCVGITGGHRLFHSPGDLPTSTSAAMLEPVGQALLRVLADLESEL